MFNPATDWALGYCLSCPDGNTKPGKIQVLATLRENNDGQLVVNQPANQLVNEFGPTGCAFWPIHPRPLEDLTGAIVRFRCFRANEHGDESTWKDWMIVQRRGNAWEVRRFEGYRLISGNNDVEWRARPRWIQSDLPGDRLFLRVPLSRRVVGPWRVGDEIKDHPGRRELIPELSPPKVYSFSVSDLPSYAIFQCYIQQYGGQRLEDILMFHPDSSFGELIDLASPSQQAKWLVERVVEALPRFVGKMDEEEPGWRRRIRDELESRINEDRTIHVDRWGRLEKILEDLTLDADQVRQALGHPKFKAAFDESLKLAIEKQIADQSAEIEQEAKRRAEAAINHEEKRIDEARKEADEQLAVLNARVHEKKTRLEGLEAKLRALKEERAEREAAHHALTRHLEESRERLARDIAIYQSLSLNGHRAVPTTARAKPTPRVVQPEGRPIAAEAAFITQRLQPILAERLGVHGVNSARILHAAINGARATLIPSPDWARAYVEALGGTGRLAFINVAPTWLAFEDLWKGGLGPSWERASAEPSAIEIVLLRDFNRALPQCHARPLLDLIAGFTDELPLPGQGAWPPSLRVLACPASPEDSIPTTMEVVQHFAAIEAPSPSAQGGSSPTPGHVPAGLWISWNGPVGDGDARAALESAIGNKMLDFSPLAPSIARDLVSIGRRLEAVGANKREANHLAIEIRIDAPKAYANSLESESKEGA